MGVSRTPLPDRWISAHMFSLASNTLLKKCSIYHKHGQEHFCYPPPKKKNLASDLTSNKVVLFPLPKLTKPFNHLSPLLSLWSLPLRFHYSCVRGGGWSWSRRQQKAWSPLLYLFHAYRTEFFIYISASACLGNQMQYNRSNFNRCTVNYSMWLCTPSTVLKMKGA